MKLHFCFALLTPLLAAACLGPSDDTPLAPYREPSGPSREFNGLPTTTQRRHLSAASFPRLQPAETKLLRRINAEVNRDLTFLPDWQNYGRVDYAVTEPRVRQPVLVPLPPARYADCEDFALTKKQRLTQAGFSASRTFVATADVPDYRGRTLHSVLAVPEGLDWLILNNWHNQIQRAGSLERWWDWKFIRPRYDSYLMAKQTRRISEEDWRATTAPGARAPARR